MHKTILIAAAMLFLVLSVVLSPDLALQASLSGISIWWNLVFPGLLPFFILYEFMLAFGLIHGFNSLLAPFITRLLKLPPSAGVPMLMSVGSGFPTGVEPTVKLLQEKQLTTRQAQRLLSYIHMPNPIFIIVILGSGVFHSAHYGYIILLSIWLAAAVLMIVHTKWSMRAEPRQPFSATNKPYFIEAMQLGQKLDGRSFGRVLGDSVYSSVQKLFIVGGFIIFASVISAFIDPVLSLIVPGLPFVEQALLEQHIGSFAIANWAAEQHSIMLVLALIAACLSFSGISGILQVSYHCHNIGISLLTFVRYRIVHAICSFITVLLLWRPLSLLFGRLPGMPEETVFVQRAEQVHGFQQLNVWLPSALLCLLIATLIAVLHLRYMRQQKN